MIKIPATLEGLPAIEETIAAGHQRQRHADLLPRPPRRGDRGVPHGPRAARRRAAATSSTVSVGGVVLREPGRHRDRPAPPRRLSRCAGKAAVANAKLAYAAVPASASPVPRWDALAAQGAQLQRPLWASTSTKNPAYSADALRRRADRAATRSTRSRRRRSTRCTTATANLRGRHGRPRTSTSARQVMADLAAAGVDFDDVTATLEREGVDSFAAVVHRRVRHPREAPRRSHRLTGGGASVEGGPRLHPRRPRRRRWCRPVQSPVASSGVRRGLGRVQREAVPGSLRILDGLFGLFDNRVLGLLCELDIPEHLDVAAHRRRAGGGHGRAGGVTRTAAAVQRRAGLPRTRPEGPLPRQRGDGHAPA